jgi:phage N-6-adenine-methyltransferase
LHTCVACGKRLPPKTRTETRGQKIFYCKDACRQKAYRDRKRAARNAKKLRDKLAVFSQDSTEWHTPARYIAAVRQVLGDIALDPASNAEADITVNAALFYDAAADGLTKTWKAATVFLNPPYCKIGGTSNQERWTGKLLSEYAAGHVGQAILLVNAATETLWFQQLYDFPICFVKGRIQFENGAGSGRKGGATTGSAFVYLGSDPERFMQVFSQFGRVVSAR